MVDYIPLIIIFALCLAIILRAPIKVDKAKGSRWRDGW